MAAGRFGGAGVTMKPLAVLLIDQNLNPKLSPIGKKYDPWRDPFFLAYVAGATVTGLMLVGEWML